MSMQEIAAKLEKKELLEKLDFLKKLNGEGEEVISKEDLFRIIAEKEKKLVLYDSKKRR